MNPPNFVPAIHFQSICKCCATLNNFSPTICDHVKKILFFLHVLRGERGDARQLGNVTHMRTLKNVPRDEYKVDFTLPFSQSKVILHTGPTVSSRDVVLSTLQMVCAVAARFLDEIRGTS